MASLITFLIILTLSLIITRVMTLALTHTGLQRDIAQFQAYSAFSGAGFTTAESESIVKHPVRRRIILLTMRLGSVGIVTIMSTLMLTFVETGGRSAFVMRFAVLLVALALLWFLANSNWVDIRLSRLINWAIERYTDLDVPDYASLLNIEGEYRVVELRVEEGDWIVDKPIGDMRLSQEGVLVLGIYRIDGEYVGTPIGTTVIHDDDMLILYGRASHIIELSNRRSGPFGHLAHVEAVVEHKEIIEEQTYRDLEIVSED